MSLDEIQGQTVAVALLRRLRASDRIAHAYVFHGPDGVGKFRAALAFAAASLCSSPIDSGACGRCADCARAVRSTHSHLHVLALAKDESEIPIESVRGVLASISLKTVDGRGRWVLVRDAEQLSSASANALLKTLEEPPPGVRLVLVTSRLQSLLPTVVSRCHRVRFGPLPDDVVASLLARERGLEPERARWAARFAGGSLGRAVRLLDEGLEERWRWVLARWGGLDGPSLVPFAEEVAEFAKAAGSGGEEQRDRVRLVLDLIATLLRDALLIGSGVAPDRLASPADAGEAERLFRRLGAEEIVSTLDQLQIAESEIAQNANHKLAFANLLLADGRIPR